MRAVADFLSSKLFHFKTNCYVKLKKVSTKAISFYLSVNILNGNDDILIKVSKDSPF